MFASGRLSATGRLPGGADLQSLHIQDNGRSSPAALVPDGPRAHRHGTAVGGFCTLTDEGGTDKEIVQWKPKKDITAEEWNNGTDILRFEVGPNATIRIKCCAHGLVKCTNSYWLVTHERISQSELVALKQYMRKVGAM